MVKTSKKISIYKDRVIKALKLNRGEKATLKQMAIDLDINEQALNRELKEGKMLPYRIEKIGKYVNCAPEFLSRSIVMYNNLKDENGDDMKDENGEPIFIEDENPKNHPYWLHNDSNVSIKEMKRMTWSEAIAKDKCTTIEFKLAYERFKFEEYGSIWNTGNEFYECLKLFLQSEYNQEYMQKW